MSQNTTQLTQHAGLIALFYGRRGQMSRLQREIGQALNLSSASPDSDNPDMSDPHRNIYLFRADSPTNHDTTVIYLALSESYANQPDDALTTWQEMRRLWQDKAFNDKLDQAASEKDQEGREVFWGYALIYHATLVPGQTLDEQTQNNLLNLARRPDLPASENAKPLAHAQIEDSDLWLMDVPNGWHGSQAATVYAALAPWDKEDRLINNILFGENADLQLIDLIAHKAYYQRRQFVSQPTTLTPSPPQIRCHTVSQQPPVLRRLYKERIGELRDSITPFLRSASQTAADSTGTRKDFKALKSKYDRLLLVTSLLDEPRLSLAQQLTNYEWWQTQLGMGILAEYHHKQIEITLKELELLIDKGQRILDATQTTIEMEQAELAQARQERETLIGALIGILGVALAVSQLIDPSAAQALLEIPTYLLGITLPAENRLLQLLVQFTITLLVTALAFWGYQKWRLGGRRE